MNSQKHFYIAGSLLMLIISCSKENKISLSENYLHVADVVQYCQGNCSEVYTWENSKALVKGYLRSVGNDSVWLDNQEQNRFYMFDSRNGFSLEIRVMDNPNIIFSKLSSVNKTDLVYVSGTTLALQAQNESNCTKGVVLQIDKETDIKINLE